MCGRRILFGLSVRLRGGEFGHHRMEHRKVDIVAGVVKPLAGLELNLLLIAHKTVCAIDGWDATLRRYQTAVAICAAVVLITCWPDS
jgi:hypothetical protein